MELFVKPFEASEYGRRLELVRRRMAEAGFDVLVCVDPANMCWLTGYDGWSFYTPQAVLVHIEDGAPVWFGRAQDAKAAHFTTGLPEENIVSYSERLVHHGSEHPFDELCDVIVARGWERARIGADMDAHYYTALAHAHLVAGLPNARIASNRELVNWARLVKSPAECAFMREAGRICSKAMLRAIEATRPGVQQNEVIAEIYQALTLGEPGAGGDYTALCPLIQVGEGTSTPHLTWSDAPLPDDVVVSLEIAGARRHYHAPLTRTLHLGPPPTKLADLCKVIVEAGDAALDVARPGATAQAVEAAWQTVLNRHGLRKDARNGYSIGIAFPPDWGERTVSLRPGDATVLEEGMCFHLQTGLWLEDIGAAVSESFIVGAAGGERLCDVARELIVID